MSWQEFIEAVANTEIEFPHLKTACLAQAIMESGRETTDLAKIHNNHHGMKWREEMIEVATSFYYETDSEPSGGAYFCKFGTKVDAVKGYWHFVWRPPYKGWRNHNSSAADFLAFIGPIWCPPGYTNNWKAQHGGLNYHEYIMAKLYPEAQQLLKNIGGINFMLLKNGSEGSQVEQLQNKLNQLGYNCGEVDGIFGNKTEGAVKGFQKDHFGESEATGIVDQRTWDQMMNHPVNIAPVLIDPGHSLKFSGTISKDGTPEYEMNLLQAKIVKSELDKAGIPSEIFDPVNDARDEIGRKATGHSMFLSIHHNAYDKKPHYTCVMVHPTIAKPQSIAFAKKLCTAVANAIGEKDFGPMKNAVTVLSESEKTDCPICVLCESYFLDAVGNRQDAETLSTKAAYAIASTVIAELQST